MTAVSSLIVVPLPAYRDALAQIETLTREPTLSPAARLYRATQVDRCRRAMTAGATRLQHASNTLAPALAKSAKPNTSDSDCGARSLLAICRELGVPASLPALTRAAHTRPGIGANLAGLTDAAKSVGLTATGVQVDADALRRVSPPAIAWVDGDHFVAVTRITDKTATIFDSNKVGREEVALDSLLQRSGGVLLIVKRSPKSAAKL